MTASDCVRRNWVSIIRNYDPDMLLFYDSVTD